MWISELLLSIQISGWDHAQSSQSSLGSSEQIIMMYNPWVYLCQIQITPGNELNISHITLLYTISTV